MSVRGRDALKAFFSAGQLPQEAHFHALIESMLHMEDEGFRKSPDRGLEISSEVNRCALISLGRREDADRPSWLLEHSNEGSRLHLKAATQGQAGLEGQGAPAPLLTLDARQRMGVNTAVPQHTLDVAGVVGSRGRAGTYFVADRAHPPLADGAWHALASGLSGCVAFEVVASASARRKAHAMMQATAMNAHNPTLAWMGTWFDGWFDRRFNRRKSIRCNNAWWGQRCDRLELRWAGGNEDYRLEIRSQCDYGPGDDGRPVEIKAHVTQLWPVFDASEPGPPAAVAGPSSFSAQR